ncbi:MAG: type II toxin-antitoxin system Phd/YefM family antitoxin [Candidatus Obscuribacterales bacterium]|nr:type II toxin-antitoxin system Phd/YefM family antitoxin [Candidatus Obscuribacterales bacterium]
MQIINIHQAKTHLSRLIAQAVKGESFLIAKSGKPLVKISRVDEPPAKRRLGFLKGEIDVPKDFDHMGAKEIAQLFNGES